MKRALTLLVIVAGLAFAAQALAFAFKIGDTVYVDGKPYTLDQWKKMRDDPKAQEQSASASTAASSNQGAAPAAGAARAASCVTPIYYDEFPKDEDEFQCTAGLGALTRGQILAKGWKVDFIEKLPPPVGQPATSPRGLPLALYKLVISR